MTIEDITAMVNGLKKSEILNDMIIKGINKQLLSIETQLSEIRKCLDGNLKLHEGQQKINENQIKINEHLNEMINGT